ncbi:hypothetical protein CUB86_00145 [Pseudomonas syringae pv. actinidiae]|uniref:Uncharacterized protein n=1 Tax=Pseudomonas syringae pv. actinidiae TaxID=103796 RepID=A0AAU8XFI5_PSESF|nr:hypothetical protein CT122_11595 [Pseudomonas syringae pv. actinidiae]PIN63522.1 hypothetical protein CUB86_00145 [Pseudomonas syringae pv. actinidiae]
MVISSFSKKKVGIFVRSPLKIRNPRLQCSNRNDGNDHPELAKPDPEHHVIASDPAVYQEIRGFDLPRFFALLVYCLKNKCSVKSSMLAR